MCCFSAYVRCCLKCEGGSVKREKAPVLGLGWVELLATLVVGFACANFSLLTSHLGSFSTAM